MQSCELILRADAPREEWLAVRNTGIGGSDAGVVLGLNKWKSPITLWAEKTGRAEPEDLSGNEAVYWGTKQEPLVAERFYEETGKKVKRRGTLRSRPYPWMLANVDRWVVGEKAGLEIKTTNAFSAAAWDGDEIPDSYYAQCLHYMAVTGAEKWYIAVLIGGQDFRWKEIPRHEEDIRALRKAEALFWRHVRDNTMPEDIDGSESTARTLSALYHEKPEAVELPEEAMDLIRRYDEWAARKKEAEEGIRECKNGLMALMGDAETATADGRKITWKTGKPRETISAADVKKKDPASYDALKAAGLVKLSAPSRVFRVW